MLYIWKHRKQERLGKERKRLDLCSCLLCAHHPPLAAGPALVSRQARRQAWGFLMVMGTGAGSACAPARQGCLGAAFNLPNRGFSWLFLFFCQVSLGRGLAVILRVRPQNVFIQPLRRATISYHLCTRGWGASSAFGRAGLGHSRLGVSSTEAPRCCWPPQPELGRML